MNIVHDDDLDPRDEELHAVLRAEYGRPAEGSYWAFLERRIMARITAESAREWWSYFPTWSRAGLAAAALALAVAGVAAWQTRAAATQEVAEWHELLGSPDSVPMIESAARASQRDSTLRYLITR